MPLTERCNGEDERCMNCRMKICSHIPIVERIISEGDPKRVKNLIAVMAKYGLSMRDYQ